VDVVDPRELKSVLRRHGVRAATSLGQRFLVDRLVLQAILEAAELSEVDDVLEVGYGPGGLIRLLAERTQAASIRGVDPSPEMRDQAGRHNRKAVRAGRVRLDLGTADRTGLPDASVDRVVSVRNVAIWPDLAAAVDELHRVARPGGTVVIAWHGGTKPSRVVKALSLPEDDLRRIEQTLRDHFVKVGRHQLTSLDVFTAVRSR